MIRWIKSMLGLIHVDMGKCYWTLFDYSYFPGFYSRGSQWIQVKIVDKINYRTYLIEIGGRYFNVKSNELFVVRKEIK